MHVAGSFARDQHAAAGEAGAAGVARTRAAPLQRSCFRRVARLPSGAMASTTERLDFLCDLSRRLATFEDLDELVRYATRRLRELFTAEGSSILLLDPTGRELRFPVASLAESRTAAAAVLSDMHFPADRGIAGWVLAHGEPMVIADVTKDARFYGGVDKATGITTRTVLAAPLRAASGAIGVVEVINPENGLVTPEDAKFLDALASHIAIAYEKADLHRRLRQEVISLRQIARLAGFGACAIGVLLVGSAIFATLAWALPWGTLPTRPPFIAGVLTVLGGGALLRAARAV